MTLSTSKIAIIGCGNLGQAIATGLLDDGKVVPANITATKRHTADIRYLADRGIQVTSHNKKAVAGSDIVIMAVKPYNMTPILREISTELVPGRHVLVSVATGYSLNEIAAVAGGQVLTIRAMPNTATDVGESITCLAYAGPHGEHVAQVEEIFNAIGQTITIDENLMEAATVLGACGIAYVLRFIRAMIQGGIQIGFDAKTATDIVNQTVKGAAQLLITRDQHPEHEIDKVTTPKGCTIVGLNEMEHNGFSSSLIRGIVASYKMIEKP